MQTPEPSSIDWVAWIALALGLLNLYLLNRKHREDRDKAFEEKRTDASLTALANINAVHRFRMEVNDVLQEAEEIASRHTELASRIGDLEKHPEYDDLDKTSISKIGEMRSMYHELSKPLQNLLNGSRSNVDKLNDIVREIEAVGERVIKMNRSSPAYMEELHGYLKRMNHTLNEMDERHQSVGQSLGTHNVALTGATGKHAPKQLRRADATAASVSVRKAPPDKPAAS